MSRSKYFIGTTVFVLTFLGGAGVTAPDKPGRIGRSEDDARSRPQAHLGIADPNDNSRAASMVGDPIVELVSTVTSLRPENSLRRETQSQNRSISLTTALQAQLDDAMRQLDSAEKEKAVLLEMIITQQQASRRKPGKRHSDTSGSPAIRGKVLAVNRSYNFVVLNLGGLHGVEVNTNMLVTRGDSFIGKIHISSVEPSTAIGDMIETSLDRGIQVRIGDTVIYAGTNP